MQFGVISAKVYARENGYKNEATPRAKALGFGPLA
jgi:hypothetical protein